MKVRKRSGAIVPFDKEFIRRAVGLAAAAAGEHDDDMAAAAADAVEARLLQDGADLVEIEQIQDLVEQTLFELHLFATAKAYILYRLEKDKLRGKEEWKEGLLSREFLSPYKHSPSPMQQLGSFV